MESPCETDSNVVSSSSSSSSNSSVPPGYIVNELPCVTLTSQTRKGIISKASLIRNVYRIGCQESICDLRLKSRYVRPLHAILIVERDKVLLAPYEDATVMLVVSEHPKSMTQVVGMVRLEFGQTFEIEGIKLRVDKKEDFDDCQANMAKKENADAVYCPERTVPIADSHIRYLEPPMGLRSPAKNKAPKRLSLEGIPAKFVSQTSIESLHRASHSEKEDDEDDVTIPEGNPPISDPNMYSSRSHRSSAAKKVPRPRHLAHDPDEAPSQSTDSDREEIKPLDASSSSSTPAMLSSQQPARRRPRFL